MMRTSGFPGMLTKFTSKRLRGKSFAAGDGQDQTDKVVERLVIRYIDQTSGWQHFLDSLQGNCGVVGLTPLFTEPVRWKNLTIDLLDQTLEMTVDFDTITFDAQLLSIKVRRSLKKDLTLFTYDLEFQKEVDREFDLVLTDYLDKFEEIDEGKWVRATYPVTLKIIP